MTAAPEDPVRQGIRSLEVRWIFPGALLAAVADWFTRFPAAQAESREDRYLIQPCLPGLSVKIRAGGTLEVKRYRGRSGLLQQAGRPLGQLEHWQKWSFPAGPPSHCEDPPPGWAIVGKRRWTSRFPQAGMPSRDGREGAEPPGCAVELTEIDLDGRPSWSLGLEAAGRPGRSRGDLEATAAQVFAGPLPAGLDVGPEYCRSYAEWLSDGWLADPAQACGELADGLMADRQPPGARVPGEALRRGVLVRHKKARAR